MDPFSFLWENHENYLIIVPVLSIMLVHELGHFITARLAGMKVEEFGFGFHRASSAKRWAALSIR